MRHLQTKNNPHIIEELRQLCAKFHDFWMKIRGETIIQSWTFLTLFLRKRIVQWWRRLIPEPMEKNHNLPSCLCLYFCPFLCLCLCLCLCILVSLCILVCQLKRRRAKKEWGHPGSEAIHHPVGGEETFYCTLTVMLHYTHIVYTHVCIHCTHIHIYTYTQYILHMFTRVFLKGHFEKK